MSTQITPSARDTSVAADDVSIYLRAAVAREFRKARLLRSRDLLLAVFTPVLLLGLWEVAARAGIIDALLFTPPSAIASRAVSMVGNGELLSHVSATGVRLLIGFFIGAALGITTGLLMGVCRPLRAALGPTFTALYSLPKIAILPLLLLVFGLTETPKIIAVAISVFFVLQINTLAGIVQFDARTLEAARAYQATGWKLFRYVLLPGATPTIMTGLKVAAGMSVVVVTAVEFVASNNGLGYLIWNSWQLFQPQDMYVGLITVAMMGATMTGLIILLERILLPWKHANGGHKNKGKK